MYFYTKIVFIMTLSLFSCCLLTLGAKPNIIVEFTKFVCVNQSIQMLELECYVNKTFKNYDTLFAKFTFAEDMDNLYGVYNLKIKNGNKFLNYLKLDVDYCQALDMGHSNNVIQSISAGLRRKSNFPFNCPFLKNRKYIVTGYTLDPKMIPVYLPTISFQAHISIFSNKSELFRLENFGQLNRK